MTYIVIGICIVLLLAVVFIAAKPIGMGIEARRNINNDYSSEEIYDKDDTVETDNENKNGLNISDEISKLNKLRIDGTLSEEEFVKAKKKLLD